MAVPRRATRPPDQPYPTRPNDCANSGIQPGQARSTALFQLATELPAALLARMLGIHISVAVAWQRAAAGDWATYAAEISRRKHRLRRGIQTVAISDVARARAWHPRRGRLGQRPAACRRAAGKD